MAYLYDKNKVITDKFIMDYDFSCGLSVIKPEGFSFIPLPYGKGSFSKNDIINLIGSSNITYINFPEIMNSFVFGDPSHKYILAYSQSFGTINTYASELMALLGKTIYGTAIIVRSDKLVNY